MKAKGWRKKFKDKKVMERDKIVFKAFSKVQYLTREQLQAIGLSDRSFDRYIKTETIEVKHHIVKDQEIALYKLTDYGREWLQKEVFNREEVKFYSSRGTDHDMKMAQILVDLLKDNEITIDQFKSEYDIQREFQAKLEELREQGQDERAKQLEELREQGKLSAPDFYIKTETTTYAVEVITNSGSYTETHLQAKQDFSTLMGYGNVEFVKS